MARKLKKGEDLEPVPLPSSETEEERQRIKASNDRDQRLEREGKPSRHNEGYDEAADGRPEDSGKLNDLDDE